MRSRLLMLSLVDMLRGNLAKVDPEIRVFLHDLPADDGEARTYPFIVCRWVSGDMNEESNGDFGCTETVSLFCGVYAPENQHEAYLKMAEMLDAVRLCLRHNPLLGERFQLEYPVSATIPDPEHKAIEYQMTTIETKWQYALPQTPLKI